MTAPMRGATLATMPLAHKVALTGFLILAILHVLGVSAAMAWTHSGPTGSTIADHYRGNEERPDVPLESLKSPKSVREILTLTHSHLAVMPIFAFLLAHILAMSALLPLRPKLAVIVLTFASIALEVLVPWLVLWSAEMAVLRHVSRAGMLITTLVGAGVPLWEMWMPGRGRRSAAS